MAEYDELRGALQRLGLELTDIDDIVHLVGERREAQSRRNDPEMVENEATFRDQLTKLLKNEEEFVSNLSIVTKTYLYPIQSGVIKMKTGTMLAIFSNFEMLAGLHKDLLLQLREAVAQFPRVSVGTLFGEFVPSMQVYTQYVNKFSASLAALEAERSKSKSFREFLGACEESHPLPLEALLSLPLNRIPYYRGVLSQVLAHTPRNGPEYIKLANVTRELSELQEYLNASKTQSDNMATVFKIESRIVGREYPLNDLHRTFIREGDVQVLSEDERDKRPKDSHVFLFNDILVVTKKLPQNQFRYKASHALQYNTLLVRERDLAVQLTHPTSRETLALGFSSADALATWAGSLQRVLADMERTTVFQTTLSEIMAREPPGALVPSVVAQLISTLERTALDVPGLFRVSGSSRAINAVISQLDRGLRVDLEQLDSHVLAGTLKQWLRTLKEPLIPFAFFDALLACHEAAQPVEALRQLVAQLPPPNVFVLKRLMQMCLRVAEHAELNKMTPTNLAIVLGPNLCREEVSSPLGEISISSSVGPLVELMQRHFHEIFPRDPPTKFSKATPHSSSVVTHTPQTSQGGLMGASRRAPRPSSPSHALVSAPPSVASPPTSPPAAAPPLLSVPDDPAPPPPSSALRLPELTPTPTAQTFPPRPSPPKRGMPPGGRVRPSQRMGPRPVPPKPPMRGRTSTLGGGTGAGGPPEQKEPAPPPAGLSGSGRGRGGGLGLHPHTGARERLTQTMPLQPPPPAPRDRSPSQPLPPTDVLAPEEPPPPFAFDEPAVVAEPEVPACAPESPPAPLESSDTPPPDYSPPSQSPPPTTPPPNSPPRDAPVDTVTPASSHSAPSPEEGVEEAPSAPEAAGVCSRCQQTVDNEFIELGPRVWHPHCFLCTICSSDLSSGYFRSEGKPICKACRRNRRTMPPVPPSSRIN